MLAPLPSTKENTMADFDDTRDYLEELEQAGIWESNYIDLDAYAAYSEENDCELEEYATWTNDVEDAYQGSYTDDAEFAYAYYDDMGETLGYLSSYVDWDRVASDLMADFYESHGYYFRY
jgi:hypothetical protein